MASEQVPWEVAYADHVNEQEAQMLRYLSIHRTCGCPKNIHAHERTAFACRHVIDQDERHPDGIIRMPKGYFLCKKCKDLLERHRLQFVYEVAATCSACVWSEIYRVVTIDPTKFVDLLRPGQGEDPAPTKA